MKAYTMKNIMFAAAFLTLAGIANAETPHTKIDSPYLSEASRQDPGKIKAATTPNSPAHTADGKRLPGRDCKLYEGVNRQHRFPQYEIGNPNRPECPAV